MSIAPLAIAEFFCSSPARRQSMENEAQNFLSSVPGLDMSSSRRGEDLAKLVAGIPIEQGGHSQLRVQYLKVDNESCYGKLSVFPVSMSNPKKADWERANHLFVSLVRHRLCGSVLLNRGCERSGLFGSRFLPAIVSPPDFARLAILKRFDMLNLSKLGEVVSGLVLEEEAVTICESEWKVLVEDCRKDARFAPALI